MSTPARCARSTPCESGNMSRIATPQADPPEVSSDGSPPEYSLPAEDRPSFGPGQTATWARGCMLALLFAACGDEKPDVARSQQAPLSPESQQIVQSLNALDPEGVAGRSHQYRLQSTCLLVVEERLHGKRKGETEVPLRGLVTKVIPYIDGSGFGLKGQAPGGPSSLDLFDSKSEATAAKAGELVAQLSARCA